MERNYQPMKNSAHGWLLKICGALRSPPGSAGVPPACSIFHFGNLLQFRLAKAGRVTPGALSTVWLSAAHGVTRPACPLCHDQHDSLCLQHSTAPLFHWQIWDCWKSWPGCTGGRPGFSSCRRRDPTPPCRPLQSGKYTNRKAVPAGRSNRWRSAASARAGVCGWQTLPKRPNAPGAARGIGTRFRP